MDLDNGTVVQEFILLGFEMDQQKQFLLLLFLCVLYVLTLVENSTIVVVVLVCRWTIEPVPHVYPSKQLFLARDVLCDHNCSCMLFDLATQNHTISFHACFLQFYIIFSLGNTEFFLLSAMALDRYMAICHPLHYPKIMSPSFCYSWMLDCWLFGVCTPRVLISKLPFCGINIIDHFVCDPVPILSLACPPFGNASLIWQVSIQSLFLGNVLFVTFSYGRVIFTLMKSSGQGSSKKGLSTISMHLLVVTLFYGTVGAMYLIQGGENHSKISKAITVFCAAVTPFLNPLIYCLRNDQVKKALGKLLRRIMRLLMTKITMQRRESRVYKVFTSLSAK